MHYESEGSEPKFEESIAERTKMRKQKGQRLKMLAPEQMLSRLSISLAELKAGNNSQKLKSEVRRFVPFKKQSRTIYNNLINTI